MDHPEEPWVALFVSTLNLLTGDVSTPVCASATVRRDPWVALLRIHIGSNDAHRKPPAGITIFLLSLLLPPAFPSSAWLAITVTQIRDDVLTRSSPELDSTNAILQTNLCLSSSAPPVVETNHHVNLVGPTSSDHTKPVSELTPPHPFPAQAIELYTHASQSSWRLCCRGTHDRCSDVREPGCGSFVTACNSRLILHKSRVLCNLQLRIAQ